MLSMQLSMIDLCLQSEGHQVWIDVEQMGGSTLEAMAGAVENAKVVLVCLSEKYKTSPNCRTGGNICCIMLCKTCCKKWQSGAVLETVISNSLVKNINSKI